MELLLNVDALTTNGSVAPISDVGTISTANAIARCTATRPAGVWEIDGYAATYSCCSRARAAGVKSAVAPIKSSVTPNHRRGCLTRSATRPAAPLPSARPAMNIAQTALAAYTVTPNTQPSVRSHRTW